MAETAPLLELESIPLNTFSFVKLGWNGAGMRAAPVAGAAAAATVHADGQPQGQGRSQAEEPFITKPPHSPLPPLSPQGES